MHSLRSLRFLSLCLSLGLPAQERQHFAYEGAGELAVSGIGDANGDGVPDFAIGWTDRVTLVSGRDGGVMHTMRGTGNFGWPVRGAGDVDNDGYADVIVGARDTDTNGLHSSAADASPQPRCVPAVLPELTEHGSHQLARDPRSERSWQCAIARPGGPRSGRDRSAVGSRVPHRDLAAADVSVREQCGPVDSRAVAAG